MRRTLTTIVLCLAAVVVVGNLGVLAAYINRLMKEERQAEGDDDKVRAPSYVEKVGGNKIVKLNPKLVDSYGVKTERATACVWRERVPVYGRVVPNPRATYEVRAPFAGTLQADREAWPTVGATVRPGQPLGHLVIRIGPMERLDLANRLADAQHKREGGEEVFALRQKLVDRLVQAQQTSVVAQRVLDDAQVQLAEAKTQLATAKSTETLLTKAVEEVNRTGPWSLPLTVPSDKALSANLEVVELAAQPGTAVEAGGLIVRVVDFSRPLVRLDVPAELLQTGPPPGNLELSEVVGTTTNTFQANRIGPASSVDAASQLAGWLYAVASNRGRSIGRPGAFVEANLPRAGVDTRAAIAVPNTAILYHQGRTLIYVRTGSDKYEKREVQILGRDGKRCILADGIRPDEMVVAQQAQVLLATEFRDDND